MGHTQQLPASERQCANIRIALDLDPASTSEAGGTNRQPSPATALSAVGLRKSFGDKTVLDGIDLTVAEGTIFSLLGPNGAGKTTTVQILSTLITADCGDVRVAGHDVAREPDAVRAVIGVTGQFSAVDDLLTGQENLILIADLSHAMPAGVRWFAENQPFTPLIETTRGLLLGTPIGNSAVIAVAWCVGIALAGYVGARSIFDRPRAS